MVNLDRMKQQAKRYQLAFDKTSKEIYLISYAKSGDIKISYLRALEWIEAGIADIDCRSKEKMIELIQSWR